MELKICSDCQEPKPVGEFPSRKQRGRDYILPRCRKCNREYRARSKKRDPAKARVYQARYYERNREKIKERRIIYGREESMDPQRKAARNYKHLLWKYNLSEEGFRSLGTTCWICDGTENLHIDHDHVCCPGRNSCGKCIRGLLCRECNLGIGKLKDDPELLYRAIDYIAKFRSP